MIGFAMTRHCWVYGLESPLMTKSTKWTAISCNTSYDPTKWTGDPLIIETSTETVMLLFQKHGIDEQKLEDQMKIKSESSPVQ